jgi:hypothetical protein
MSNYTALIADVRGSRDLDNWPEIFQAITRTLTQANKRFKADLVVKFHPTVGDEFQGVLARPEIAFEAYIFLKASLSPVRLYFGLGVGEVEKSGPGDTGLRGTAFYRARAAVEECKEYLGFVRVKSSEPPSFGEKMINGMLRLMDTVELNWTERQREIATYSRLNPNMNHADLSAYFTISRATVTQTLNLAKFKIIQEAENLVKSALTTP